MPLTLDQNLLQQQVNYARYNGPVSWRNFRYSGLLQEQTDQNGVLWIFFEPAFDNEILGFTCCLDFSGGFQRWAIGYQLISKTGFQAAIWDPFAGLAPVANRIVGIYYIAVGR